MKIVKKAQETFETQPELKALFLFDPHLNYREEIEEIESNGIQVLTVRETEGIQAKYLIEQKSNDKKILVYCPFRKPSGKIQQQFHLLDVLYANKILSLDPIDDLIEEYKLPRDQYELLKKYYDKGLKYKKDRRPLEQILNPSLTDRKLKIGLCQRILGLSRVSPSPTINETLALLFSTAIDPDLFKEKVEALKELELNAFLGRELSHFFDLDDYNLTIQNVKTAVQKLKYNLLVGPIGQSSESDPYEKLQLTGSHVHSRLSAFIIEWKRNPAIDETPENVIRKLAPQVSEEKLIEIYGADAPYGLATGEVITAVLKYLVPFVKNQPRKVLNTLRNYRDDLREENTSIAHSVSCLWHIAVFYNEFKNHPIEELDTPSDYTEAYQSHYYEIDYRYRKAVSAFKQIDDSQFLGATELDAVIDEFLAFYQSEFIHKLNIGWQQRLSDIGFDFSKLNTSRQSEFYKRYVASSDIKTAVIISDAFRYEAAQELFKVLKRDTKKVLNIEPMLAAVPSHTALGMASLLPMEELNLQDGDYIADGVNTKTTDNRKAILQKADPATTAITALDFEEMSQDERRSLFKEYSTVYIYHNLIDTIGEQRTTEKNVFDAVDDTIEELDKLISKIHGANVYRFLITADHGFNYLENKLDDATLEDSPDVKGKMKSDSRFVITSEKPEGFAGYTFPISATSAIKEDYYVALPRAVNRFRHPGVRYHYVHGGASLQEVLVPVLEVNRKREDKGQKVDIKLVSNKHVITTGSAQIELLQVQSVGEKRNPKVVKFGFYNDAKELVSDEQEVVFEATSGDATLRKKKILLTLTSKANELSHCTLLGFDEDDHNKLNSVVNQRYTIRRIMGKDEF